jgi:hypothetical protein
MSAKSFSAVAVSCLLAASLVLSNSAQAAVQQNQLTQQEIDKILKREQVLEQQVSVLSSEIKDIKAQQQVHPHHYQRHFTTKEKGYGKIVWHPVHSQTSADEFKKLNAARFTQGVAVTTSPYFGLRSDAMGFDRIVNIVSTNEAVRLLQLRQKLENQAAAAGITPVSVNHPLIEVSGALEGQGVYFKPSQGPSTNTIDLTRAQFDVLSQVSPWITALMEFKYDASPLPSNIQGSGQRIANSRVYISQAFMTIGNLNKSPFYFSLGQMNAPFGRYYSGLLSNPITQTLGQTRNRLALLGFYKSGFYGQAYVFQGDAHTSGHQGINTGGVNGGYLYDNGGVNTFYLGGGYINDIADSLGMQKTGISPPSFPGFGFHSGTEQLVHLVPGVDLDAHVSLNKLTLVSEFITATRSFDPTDLSFDNNGAEPKALHLEGDYSFNMFNWPSFFTLAYGHSWQALGVNVPKDSYIAVLTTSIWKDTIEAIEFRHDQNYPTSDTSGGEGFPVVASVGGSQNTVTLQAGVYF